MTLAQARVFNTEIHQIRCSTHKKQQLSLHQCNETATANRDVPDIR